MQGEYLGLFSRDILGHLQLLDKFLIKNRYCLFITLLLYQSQINFLKQMKFCNFAPLEQKFLEIWCSFQNFNKGHFAPPIAIIHFNDTFFANFVEMLALCPKAYPWRLDTLMKHFVLTFALAIIIILVLLFIDFHKLFTEQVKYYCNYHNYDDNNNENNY